MQTPLTTGVFWEQLAKSGLLPAERIAAVARELKKRGVGSEADAANLLVRKGLLTRYQSDRLLEGRSRGFFFDQYRVLDLLGAGGMGWVYRAAESTTNEVVALKVLLDRHKEDRGMLARFQQESRAGLLLDHPHIVRTRATGSAGGMLYMVMDFVEGPSLLEFLLRKRFLPWSMACDIARQAALGLHHANQAGWVHRDVKPQNLLIDRKGHVKVLDFGLAMMREGEGGDEFSMAMIFGHECIGTPAFMAPEQAKDSLTADARADVYGLGCTLFAALTGDTPFPLRNPHDVVKAHQTQMPRSVRSLVPEIPQGVADIVAKMLAKKPEDRFQSCAEVASALTRWSRTESIDFDFQELLDERNQSAMERVAELHKSRPIPSGPASSTTRLEKLSSVAQASDEHPTFGNGRSERAAETHARARSGPEHLPDVINQQVDVTGIGAEHSEFRPPHHGKVLQPLGGGPTIPLVAERIVIGRANDADLQIRDSSISGRHCELLFDGASWWITDLKSRNGTRVNGKTVNRRQIADGDVILIGNSVRLRLEDPRKASSDHPAKARRSLSTVFAVLVVAAAAIAAVVALTISTH